MGYELNTHAYTLFTQIEVGIREFMINLIRNKGVDDWSKNFLGNVHLDSIKDVGKRIYEANQKQIEPTIEDIYISKLYRELKTRKESFKGNVLLHPFYYLTWSDLDGLLRKSNNSELIINEIGKLNRDVLINNIGTLNFLRNDIAHSRFITENDLNYIKAAFDQISRVIPNFNQLYNSQYSEETLSTLIYNFTINLKEIESQTMIDISKVEEFELITKKCLNSFWLNSIFPNAIPLIKSLSDSITKYKYFRQSPGGLLKIQSWKKENLLLFSNIKIIFDERKVSD